MQQVAAGAITIVGQSNCPQLMSGHSFSIKEVPLMPYNGSSASDGQYVLTSVDHRAELGLEYRSGDAQQDRFYGNRFTCIPSGLPYAPTRLTPRPVIQGPQTAVVVKGPGGDEIFTDPYGRVKVQFHWDRSGEPNPDSSCWIRVAHHNSGSNFGMIYIPRGDQEVIVSFEEGDPDRPIITGSVYNPNLMSTYVLPTKKMVTGFRTNTYPGGGGYNEISSDDTAGGEQIFMHGQKDMDQIINNDSREHVQSNRHMIIGNPQAAFGRRQFAKCIDRGWFTGTARPGGGSRRIKRDQFPRCVDRSCFPRRVIPERLSRRLDRGRSSGGIDWRKPASGVFERRQPASCRCHFECLPREPRLRPSSRVLPPAGAEAISASRYPKIKTRA